MPHSSRSDRRTRKLLELHIRNSPLALVRRLRRVFCEEPNGD